MKRGIPTALVLCLIAGLFSRCRGPQYEPEEMEVESHAGEKAMQAWLDEHIPGAKVLYANACTAGYPSGPEYLTELVEGAFDDGEEKQFLYNMSTGEVYLGIEESELVAVCRKYVPQFLGLEGQIEPDPDHYSGASLLFIPEQGPDLSFTVAPAEIVLNDLPLETLFAVKGETPWLISYGDGYLAEDEADLSRYPYSKLREMMEEANLSINVDIKDQEESLAIRYSGKTYERYGWEESPVLPEARFWVREDFCSEKADGTEEKQATDFANDLTITPTDRGYRFDFTDWFPVNIYTTEGTSLQAVSWEMLDENGNGRPMAWKDYGKGLCLVREKDGSIVTLTDGNELVQKMRE